MTLTSLLNRSCVIERRAGTGATNSYGDETTSTVSTSTVCELQQRQRTESSVEGEVSQTDWLLVLPAGTLIAHGDAVTVDGLDYEVHGDPWRARNPRTQAESHVEATVRRTGAEDDEPAGS